MTQGQPRQPGQVEKSPGSALAVVLGVAFAVVLGLFALARKPAPPPAQTPQVPWPQTAPTPAAPAFPEPPAPPPKPPRPPPIAELVGEQSSDRPDLTPVAPPPAPPIKKPAESANDEAPPAGAPYIRVRYPNGGETIARETEFTVRWESSGIAGNVKIMLKGGTGLGGNWTIAPSAPNTGEFVYKIPQNYGYNEFRIIVISSDGSISDGSDGLFTSKLGR